MRLLLPALLLALSPVLPLRTQTLNNPGFKAPGAALVTSSAALDAKAEISVVGGGGYAGFTAIYFVPV